MPVEVVGVRFKAAGKVYYFDPDGAVFREGDTVIVETARGIEFGFVVGGNRTVM
ncbi:MAG: stage 0 sporulation protein, partial [Eubacteriales bacterium]